MSISFFKQGTFLFHNFLSVIFMHLLCFNLRYLCDCLLNFVIMQIRVHLQCAGHPIANDMLYRSEDVPSRSANGVGADRAASGTCKPPMSNSHKDDSFAEDSASEEFSIDPMCTNCPNLPPKGYGFSHYIGHCNIFVPRICCSLIYMTPTRMYGYLV